MVGRRLHIFASSTAVDLDNHGRVYPRTQLMDLLVDILHSNRGMQKRVAMAIVRDALSSVTLEACGCHF